MSDSTITRRGFFRRLAQAGAAVVVAVALPKEAASRPIWWDRWRYWRVPSTELVQLAPKDPYIGPVRMPGTIREFVSPGTVNDGARALERIFAKVMRP